MENLKTLVPKGYSYFHIESNSEEEVFCIKEITNGAEAEEWMRKLSNENKTTWRVSRTYPNAGRRIIYRKDYRCQHSTDRRATGAGPSKNTNCPARLNIIIRSCRKSLKSHDAEILKEYPAEIVLREAHNHPIVCVESMRYRDMSDETRQKLLTLLQKGYSPASAINYLKLELMCEYPDNYYKIASDNSFLPSNSIVCKLFKKEADENGLYPGEKVLTDLEELVRKYDRTNGGKTRFQKTSDGIHCFAVIISSLMLRCHQEVKQCSELVLLDVSGMVHKNRHKTYMFMTPTVVGGLPLGLIITDCEKEYVFTEALLCYKELLSNEGFCSVGYPKIILTNNAMKERGCLQTAFPESSLLLSQFHMLKMMWTWLCSRKNNINVDHRQKLYFLFKQVVHSFEFEEAESNASDFISEVDYLGYTKLEEHFVWLWDIKQEWITCYRKEALKYFSEHEWRDDSLLFRKVMNNQLSAEEHFQFQKLVERISNSISSNPDIFVPAVKKMLMNEKTYASTDNGLISAMCSFGVPAGVKSASQTAAKNLTKKSCKILIAAQYSRATHRNRKQRKIFTIGRNRQRIERAAVQTVPSHMQLHNYTSFGSLPKRKKTGVDSLDQSVLDNKSLSANLNRSRKPENNYSFERSELEIPVSDHVRSITVDELANLEMQLDDQSQFIIVIP